MGLVSSPPHTHNNIACKLHVLQRSCSWFADVWMRRQWGLWWLQGAHWCQPVEEPHSVGRGNGFLVVSRCCAGFLMIGICCSTALERQIALNDRGKGNRATELTFQTRRTSCQWLARVGHLASIPVVLPKSVQTHVMLEVAELAWVPEANLPRQHGTWQAESAHGFYAVAVRCLPAANLAW